MGVAENIRELAESVPQRKRYLRSEEATKNSLVMPFLSALGYDIHDPLEVIPELTADAGVRQHAKVDYAIAKDGKPIILVECKSANTSLNQEHLSQLLGYYAFTDARYGILTNGVEYRFYTDLHKPNVMDESPFLVVDMLNLKEGQIEEICRFAKSAFDAQAIWDLVKSRETEQKDLQTITDNIAREFASPSRELVRLLAKGVLGKGHQRKAEWERITNLTRRALDRQAARPVEPVVPPPPVPLASPAPAPKPDFDAYVEWEQVVSNKALHKLLTDLYDYLSTLEVEVKPIKWGFSVKREQGGFYNLLYIWPKPGRAYLMVQLKLAHGTVSLEEGFIRDISQIKKHRGYTHMIYIRNHEELERAKPLIKRSYDEVG